MSRDDRETRAVARWQPPRDSILNRSLTLAVVMTSRIVMRVMNRLTINGADRFDTLMSRGERGLLTFSNHVSLFDDPLLLCNLKLPPYREIRWVASDALNFFDSRWKAFIFGAGKCVPIVRGAGFDQMGFDFLRDRLKEGGWVHIFPEGGRTRNPHALMEQPFKSGVGRLMAEARPIALPMYHTGMQDVLPVGARLPRWGKRVCLVIGEPLDCRAIAADELPAGPGLWNAFSGQAYGALRRLELAANPRATDSEGVPDVASGV